MYAAGFVLVGGNSSRMGRDKALLPGRSRYLVEEIAERVQTVAGNVLLVGNPERYRHLKFGCIRDLRPSLGPLSGIETVLLHSNQQLNLILACDMPEIAIEHLANLLRRAQASSALCVATRDFCGQKHPLPAVYKSECTDIVKCRLEKQRLSLMGLLEDLHADYVHLDTVLDNLNTPDDWARWRQAQA